MLEKFHFLKTPSAAQLAVRELEEARKDLLKSEAAAEHWTHTTTMLQARIRRLQRLVEGNNA